MIKYLLRTKDRRLIAIYVLTSLLIYGAFWFSYYLIEGKQSIVIAVCIVIAGLLPLLIRKKSKKAQEPDDEDNQDNKATDEIHTENEYKYDSAESPKKPKFPFIPIVSIILINIGIGFTISAFFLITKIVPSRFFGLVLLIMLGYKIVQLVIGEFFQNTLKSKWLFRTLYIFCLILEIIGAILIAVYAWQAEPIMWQVFYALLLCIFYSFGQLYLRKQTKKNFWDVASMAYLLGFVFIFVIAIIILSIFGGDGSIDLGGLGDLGPVGNDKKKRKKLDGSQILDDSIFK